MTPTHELLIEILAAHYQLGHKLWPIKVRYARDLKELEVSGYVFSKNEIVDGAILAGLTPKGRQKFVPTLSQERKAS